MESSIWHRLWSFIKGSYTEKFKFAFPGIIIGFYGGKSLFFSGLAAEVVTILAYAVKYIGTVFMAFSSGLATAYAAYLIERHKESQKKSPNQNRNKNAA